MTNPSIQRATSGQWPAGTGNSLENPRSLRRTCSDPGPGAARSNEAIGLRPKGLPPGAQGHAALAPRGSVPGGSPAQDAAAACTSVAPAAQPEDWTKKQVESLPAGTVLLHGARSGFIDGVGQSGYAGEAIWLASANDPHAAEGYATSSGRVFTMKTTEPLKLAVTDGAVHVEPDELDEWRQVAEQHGLHGVKTNYVGPSKTTYEVVLFDRSKIAHHSAD